MNAALALSLAFLSAAPSAAAHRDVTDAQIRKVKASIDCKVGRLASYCKALDLFAKGAAPDPRTASYAATVLYVMPPAGKPADALEGVNQLALGKGGALFSRLMPDNADEQRQLNEFLSLSHANKPVPAGNAFLRAAKALPARMRTAEIAGKSLYFSEQDRGFGRSDVFVRQSAGWLFLIQFNQAKQGVPLYAVGIAH